MKSKTTILAILISSVCWAQKLVPTDTTALLKVKVVDVEGKIASGQLVTFTNPKTKKDYNGVSNETGYFEMLIPDESIFIECPGDNLFMPLNTGVSPCG